MPLIPETKPTPIPEETITPDVEVNTNIPDISFIVEDGNIVPSANSYCDLDFADEYAANKGYADWLQLSDDEKKINIIRGTEFVDNFYTWKGVKKSSTQSLSFPRGDVYDRDGYPVLGIPDKLKKACIEASVIVMNNASTTLFETKDENGDVKKTKVDTLEVEYFENRHSSSGASNIDYTSIYDILNHLLKDYYETADSRGSSICGKALWVD